MSSYSDLVLANANLVVYYRLGEASGLVLDDVGPNNLDGTIAATGVTYGVAGAIANDATTALTFDASTPPTARVDNNALDLGDGPLSIEFWVKRSATQSAIQTLILKGTNAYQVQFRSDNKLYLAKSGVGLVGNSSNTITDTTTWHHVVITKSGSARKIYVDGADVTVLTTDATLADTTSDLAIGSTFPGSMDEVALYNAVLSATDVLQHYRTGVGAIVLADSVGSTDGKVSEPEAIKADSVTASETRVLAPEKALSDTATTSEARTLEPGAILSDSVTASEARAADVEAGLSDTASLADGLTTEEGNFIVLGDSVSATDDSAAQAESALSDSVSASESRALEPESVQADSVTATDATVADAEAVFSDTAVVTDGYTTEGAGELALGDSVTLSDGLSTSVVPAVQPSDGGGWVSPRRRPERISEVHLLTFEDVIRLMDAAKYDVQMDPDLAREEELVLALI